MASSPDLETEPNPKAAEPGKGEDAPPRNWLIPVATVLILASAFCAYYFVYVGARREYLVNRNFRTLAALGDQLQRILSIHSSILEFYADLVDPNRAAGHDRKKQNLSMFLVVRPEDQKRDGKDQTEEARRDYLRYLAPTLDLIEEPKEKGVPSKAAPRLEVQRRDGRWQLMLRALPHKDAKASYMGSLDLAALLKGPAESLPFDDILLASEDGTIVYQNKKAGPQFTTLPSLLKARVGDTGGKPAATEQSAEPGKSAGSDSKQEHGEGGSTGPKNAAWRGGSIHLTDVLLAGTRYKLFVQPVLIDVFSDDPLHAEPPHEWVICGLRASSALEWEALSVSYTFMIGFTALFLAICMGTPLLKVIFINHREHLRLRELGFLSLFLVLLAGVFTLTALEVAEFRRSDETESQLHKLGEMLSVNVHDDLRQMRDQLQDWCSNKALHDDLQSVFDHKVEVIRYITDHPSKTDTPLPSKYAFVHNAFWTDDDGHQVVKWSISSGVTPLIDLSKQSIFTAPKRIYLDATGPPFHFDSILPPNKLEYLAALTISNRDCGPRLPPEMGDLSGGAAFLAAQPFSLIDPILPLGYGFALVDDTGRVLFHTDKTRNGRENFREENDWSKELYAGTFGHSTVHSLSVNYLGNDYRAVVVPIPGVTQASWSLIVYADLTVERTRALQTMTMASTLLLLILVIPAFVIGVWCLAKRLHSAPEWLWPDPRRIGTYWYQIFLYLLLIGAFLFLGFRGPVERIVVACAAVPYSALLLTLWCYLRYQSGAVAWRSRPAGDSRRGLWTLTIVSAALFLFVLVADWGARLLGLVVLPIVVGIAIVPLLDGPRRYLAAILRRRQRVSAAAWKLGARYRESFTYVRCYVLSVLLLLLLVGVLMPMALFRGCLAVERRLDMKRAQLHLASALAARRAAVQDKCDRGEMGPDPCAELQKKDSPVWRKIVLNPVLLGDRDPSIEAHEDATGQEFYATWFRNLVYMLHHDYNFNAAETLGVIADRIPPKPDTPGARASEVIADHIASQPDWFWTNSDSTVTLRWHGMRRWDEEFRDKEGDLSIASEMHRTRRGDVLAGFGIAVGVMLALGGILWMLVNKVFLIHLAPLKITGLRELAEVIRMRRNVLVLVPPEPHDLEFEVESAAQPLDLAAIAQEPGWAETASLEPPPPTGVTVVRHFEYTSDTATAHQKAAFLERLIERESRQIAVIMRVPASTVDYRTLFPKLTVVDLRDEPIIWLKEYAGPARDLIWEECKPVSPLWPLGAQLARDIRSEAIGSDDTIVSEMLERADPYYRLVWKECSNQQKFVLSQLAEDGLVNPMNGRPIRQLVRRGFIVQDPQFRIMNESFRRFLRTAGSDELKQQWLRDAKRSGWGRVHNAFFTTMIVLGVFLLTTQNALWQSSAAYVTTAFGALGTLAKLFNNYRGTATPGKSS